jgi:hypothetical protein
MGAFASGLTICFVATFLMVSLGFAWDWFERSRGQQSQRSTPPDRRQLEP